ncbi:hypothetical protein NDU88_000711 [Pleurodeles waltl]|uniref:Uncharacterized protein n=1 Tax=Pleurodeles waltl TaxID=8319 RepID=A0AAV7U5F0_PLEWA|nr:hypothetical protein NDU88_000711 [Pleurodeles waltl]
MALEPSAHRNNLYTNRRIMDERAPRDTQGAPGTRAHTPIAFQGGLSAGKDPQPLATHQTEQWHLCGLWWWPTMALEPSAHRNNLYTNRRIMDERAPRDTQGAPGTRAHTPIAFQGGLSAGKDPQPLATHQTEQWHLCGLWWWPTMALEPSAHRNKGHTNGHIMDERAPGVDRAPLGQEHTHPSFQGRVPTGQEQWQLCGGVQRWPWSPLRITTRVIQTGALWMNAPPG